MRLSRRNYCSGILREGDNAPRAAWILARDDAVSEDRIGTASAGIRQNSSAKQPPPR